MLKRIVNEIRFRWSLLWADTDGEAGLTNALRRRFQWAWATYCTFPWYVKATDLLLDAALVFTIIYCW